MFFLKRIFKLPSPKDLNMSPYNALPCRAFTPDCDGPTWEDWEEKVKKMHPVKFWFSKTLDDFLEYKLWIPFTRPIIKFYDYIVYNFVPSKKYHLLDLRQPKNKYNVDNYKYGWRDVPDKMLYAMFNLLGDYLNKEKPHDLTKFYSRDQINADAGLKMQQDALDEAREIYRWWCEDRKIAISEHNALLEKWGDNRNYISLDELNEKEKIIDQKTDEMVLRLIKIRRTLWT